ncbi:MAG TPA: fimbria/pilus outer membrane usher protein [Rhizomicrobium sp.]|jgi:outer membrane usher protein|nr:fimbria/pilus outer membrane usher protein [Rhizomicrobium sp.]
MRRLSLLLVCGTLCGGASASIASNVVPPSPGQKLILDVWVNGVDTSVIAKIIKRDGLWLASAADLKDAGINLNNASPGGPVALSKIDGLTVEVDQADQRLMIEARADCLNPQIIELRPSASTSRPGSSSGVVASYEVTGTAGDPNGSAGVDALLGADFFSPLGTLSTTGFSDTSNSGSRLVRLDSTAEWDDASLLRRWVLGDSISGGLAWSRSVRFGGFQMATDFTLAPGLTTLPLPAFFGQSAVPGTVDVFVNSARVFEGDVSPGPFELHDLPVVTGDGQATIVVRNVLGQETTQTFSFYASDALLREGLSSYDFDFGLLRRFYGEKNLDYGRPVATGTYRYGLTDILTLETHTEGAANLALVGGGGSLALGSFGVVGGDAAISRNALGTGELYAVSFASASHPFGVFGSLTATTGSYLDLASLGGPAEARLMTQLGANAGFHRTGSVSVSWVGVKDMATSAVQLINASYTLSFNQGWSFSATGLHDCTNRSWAAELSLSVPLGNNLFASASAQTGGGTKEREATVMRPTNPDGGFGYSISASAGDSNGANGEATYVGEHGTLDGAVSSVNGETAGRISASGAFVFMNGAAFSTRNPEGALALVETGQPDIPVYLENRQVARSDSDGEALLTNLTANAPNRISVEATDYSFSTVMNATEQIVVPRRQSGVVADLAPAPSRPALVTLELDNGLNPPAGAEVRLSNSPTALPLGHHGQLFVTDLEKAVSGVVTFPGGSCLFQLVPPREASSQIIPRIGPVRCYAGRSA